MFVLVAYDANDNRSEIFRKLLSKYLVHEQNSVFSGNLPESKFVKLRSELSDHVEPFDSVMIVTAENRHNVEIHRLEKSVDNGIVAVRNDSHHVADSIVL